MGEERERKREKERERERERRIKGGERARETMGISQVYLGGCGET